MQKSMSSYSVQAPQSHDSRPITIIKPHSTQSHGAAYITTPKPIIIKAQPASASEGGDARSSHPSTIVLAANAPIRLPGADTEGLGVIGAESTLQSAPGSSAVYTNLPVQYIETGGEVYVTTDQSGYGEASFHPVGGGTQLYALPGVSYYQTVSSPSVGSSGGAGATPHTHSVAPPLYGGTSSAHQYIVHTNGGGGSGLVGSSVTIGGGSGARSGDGESEEEEEDMDEQYDVKGTFDMKSGAVLGSHTPKYLGIAGPSAIQQAQHATRASPVTVQWLLENYETAEGVSLPRATLYAHYLRHCHEQHLDAMNPASFGKLIRSVFLGLRTRRLGTRGNSKYHYYGIRIKANSQLHHMTDDLGAYHALAMRHYNMGLAHQMPYGNMPYAPYGHGMGSMGGHKQRYKAMMGSSGMSMPMGAPGVSPISYGPHSGATITAGAAPGVPPSNAMPAAPAVIPPAVGQSAAPSERTPGPDRTRVPSGVESKPFTPGGPASEDGASALTIEARAPTQVLITLPSFGDLKVEAIEEIQLMADLGLGLEDLSLLETYYRDHCQEVLDSVAGADFAQVAMLWQRFWSCPSSSGEGGGGKRHRRPTANSSASTTTNPVSATPTTTSAVQASGQGQSGASQSSPNSSVPAAKISEEAKSVSGAGKESDALSAVAAIYEDSPEGGEGTNAKAQTMTRDCLIKLCELPTVVAYMRASDYSFYQTLVRRLIPDLLQPIQGGLTQAIRNFAKSLEAWMWGAMSASERGSGSESRDGEQPSDRQPVPTRMRECKLEVLGVFAQALRRYTSLNHLAQAARAVLANAQQTGQMLTDLSRIDFHHIEEQANWVCQCPSEYVAHLQEEFRRTLTGQHSLEHWAGWLDNLLGEHLARFDPPNSSPPIPPPKLQAPETQLFISRGRDFLLKWSYFSSLVIRDLTLRSAASFGSFHLIRLLLDEYLFYALEARIASRTALSMLQIMHELRPADERPSSAPPLDTESNLSRAAESDRDSNQGSSQRTAKNASSVTEEGPGAKQARLSPTSAVISALSSIAHPTSSQSASPHGLVLGTVAQEKGQSASKNILSLLPSARTAPSTTHGHTSASASHSHAASSLSTSGVSTPSSSNTTSASRSHDQVEQDAAVASIDV